MISRLSRLLVLTAVLTAAVVAPTTSPAAADDPLMGRRYFVVALMRNVGLDSFVRLSQYELRADGTLLADAWAWNSQTLHPRTPSGFTTTGCQYACTVWTAEGFEAGTTAIRMNGTWSASGTDFTIAWQNGSSSPTERWKIDNSRPTATRLVLASHKTATDGFGWGSTTPLSVGVNVATIAAKSAADPSGRIIYSGPRVVNNYGTTDPNHVENLTVRPNQCNVNCLDISSGTNKAYLVGTGVGRKMYYNHQLYSVDPAPCIGGSTSFGAGHLKPSLQIIDDAGEFRGLITVEASLYAFKTGSDIIGIFDTSDLLPLPTTY